VTSSLVMGRPEADSSAIVRAGRFQNLNRKKPGKAGQNVLRGAQIRTF